MNTWIRQILGYESLRNFVMRRRMHVLINNDVGSSARGYKFECTMVCAPMQQGCMSARGFALECSEDVDSNAAKVCARMHEVVCSNAARVLL